MEKYRDTVLDQFGSPIEGAEVAVTVNATGAVPTIYSDDGVTETPNPIITDANGAFGFYAANGRYKLTISGRVIATARVVSDILLYDSTD